MRLTAAPVAPTAPAAPSCASAARQISASGAAALLQPDLRRLQQRQPVSQRLGGPARAGPSANHGLLAEEDRRPGARRPTASTDAPPSTRRCSRSRRSRKRRGDPEQPDRRLALGQQAVERALELRPAGRARRHGRHRPAPSAELSPTTAATSSRLARAARLVGQIEGELGDLGAGHGAVAAEMGCEIGQRRRAPRSSPCSASSAAHEGRRDRAPRRGSRAAPRPSAPPRSAGAGWSCRRGRRPRARRSPPGPAAPADRARRRWRDRRRRARAPAGGRPAGTAPAPPRPAGRGAMRSSSADSSLTRNGSPQIRRRRVCASRRARSPTSPASGP